MSADKVKTHPLWKDFARDDALLSEYVGKMFAEMKKKYNYDTAMGFYLASGEKVSTLRVAFVCRLGCRSQLDGGLGLGGDVRVVGIAPEALGKKFVSKIR